MNKKELAELGIEDEDVQKAVLKLHGLGIEKFKGDVKTLTEDKESLTTQITKAGEQIEAFKKLDVEGIQKAADDYKAQAEKAEADKLEVEEARVSDQAKVVYDKSLDAGLNKAGAKNLKSVKALLNNDELKISEDGSSIAGLEVQLESIAKENEFLFASEETTPKIVKGGKNQSILKDSVVQAAREAAGVAEEG
ncbi:phage scaffolding protein [bacterium]|nr:phage scaffolding protein [bacterium]